MFNPFGDKQLSELTAPDLAALIEREVAEGHYVEYKSELVPARVIAKSVAAFANSHGGWLFLGVEADKDTNAATRLTGLDRNDPRAAPDTIQKAVEGNLDPKPLHRSVLVDVGNDRSVLVVQVPEGDHPPYIHNDGRIYRRQGAASDPVPETARHTIDLLYAKSHGVNERFREFATLPWTMSKAQAGGEQPWVEIYIQPEHPADVTGHESRGPSSGGAHEELLWWNQEIGWQVRDTCVRFHVANPPLDVFYSTWDGYCIWQNGACLRPHACSLFVDASLDGSVRLSLTAPKLNDENDRTARGYASDAAP